MTTVASPSRKAHLCRRFLTGHGAARPNTQLARQSNRSSSINAAVFARPKPFRHRTRVDSCPPSASPQLTPRTRDAQIPIAHAAPPYVPPSRFPPLQAFGRRPPQSAAPFARAAGIRNPSHQRPNGNRLRHFVSWVQRGRRFPVNVAAPRCGPPDRAPSALSQAAMRRAATARAARPQASAGIWRTSSAPKTS